MEAFSLLDDQPRTLEEKEKNKSPVSPFSRFPTPAPRHAKHLQLKLVRLNVNCYVQPKLRFCLFQNHPLVSPKPRNLPERKIHSFRVPHVSSLGIQLQSIPSTTSCLTLAFQRSGRHGFSCPTLSPSFSPSPHIPASFPHPLGFLQGRCW